MGLITGLIIGGIASAIAALGSGVANSVSNYNATKEANETNVGLNEKALQFNAEQAQIQRDWEERMSNTAYQRSMADMEQAGLNPLLAAQLGGASTPSGYAASGQASRVQANPIDFSGLASAMNALQSTMLTSALLSSKGSFNSGTYRAVISAIRKAR